MWSYRPQLDGLRAFAVLAVVGFHYLPGQFRGGHLGVELFFVLSGYLITGLLVSEQQDRGRIDLYAFWARRALRLYPALVVMVVVTLVLAQVTGHPGISYLVVVESAAAALLFVNDFALLKGKFTLYLDPTWSLGVEEQFYIGWQLVLRHLLKRSSPVGLGRLTAGVAAGFAVANAVAFAALGFPATYFTPLGHASALLAGSAVALLRPAAGRILTAAASCAGILLVASVFVAPDLHDPLLWHGPQQLFALAAALVIAHQAVSQFRPLASTPLVWLGRRSYSIYLWHQVVLVALTHSLPHAGQLSIAALGIPVSVAAGALSYRYVERPFVKFKARFARVRGAAATVPLADAVAAPA